jgi:hypothetical protein
MAYMNQERKAKLAPAIKAALKKYRVRGTISTDAHGLTVTIKAGSIDFIKNYNETVAQRPGGFRLGAPAEKYMQVNTYWYHEHFSGRAKDFLDELVKAMNVGNHDNSDIMDYFDVGWYVHVNVGRWNKPYLVEA